MVGPTERTDSQKGYKIVLRPTLHQKPLHERQELARLSEEQRKRLSSVDRGTAQRSRQAATEAAVEFPGFPDDHDDGGDLEDFTQPPGYMRWLDLTSETYAERLQRKETGWQQIQEALVSKSIEAKPANAALRLRQHDELKQAIEEAAGRGQQCLRCHQPLQVQEFRPVSYWGSAGHILLQLPGLHCNVCDELWESAPVTYDSFGNAPKQPSVVSSSDLLQLFRFLSKKGLSAADFALPRQICKHSVNQLAD